MRGFGWLAYVLILGAAAVYAVRSQVFQVNAISLYIGVAAFLVSLLLLYGVFKYRKAQKHDPLKALRVSILQERLNRLTSKKPGNLVGLLVMSFSFDEYNRQALRFLEIHNRTPEEGVTLEFFDSLREQREWLNKYYEVQHTLDNAARKQGFDHSYALFKLLESNGFLAGLVRGSDLVALNFICVQLGIKIADYFPMIDWLRSDASKGQFVFSVFGIGMLTPDVFTPHLPYINQVFGRVSIGWGQYPNTVELRRAPKLPAVIPLVPDGRRVTIGTDADTGEVVAVEPDKLPHTLVVGTAGFGKSVFLHQLVTQLVHIGNGVQLYLVDLKGGVEFVAYEGQPGVRVVDQFDQVAGLVDDLVGEMQRRFEVMRQNRWRLYPNQRIFLVVDEFAQVQLWPVVGKEEKATKDRLLANLNRLAMLGRAAGVCIIAATQKATTDAMDSSFRNNLVGAVCFRVGSRLVAASMFGSADDLKADPVTLERGRFLYYDSEAGRVRLMQAHMTSEAN